MAKQKRRADAPVFASVPHPPTKGAKQRLAAARARRRVILDRTAAGLAANALAAEGADMRELADLPVITYPGGRAPKLPGMRRVARPEVDEEALEGEAVVEAPAAARPTPPAPIAPAVDVLDKGKRIYICQACQQEGHSKLSKKCRFYAPPTCKGCNEVGHSMQWCPQRRALRKPRKPRQVATTPPAAELAAA